MIFWNFRVKNNTVRVFCARSSQREGRSLSRHEGRDHFSQWGKGISVGFFTETTSFLRNPGVRRSPSYEEKKIQSPLEIKHFPNWQTTYHWQSLQNFFARAKIEIGIKGAQLNMTVFLLYLKKILVQCTHCTRVHWKSHFFQGTYQKNAAMFNWSPCMTNSLYSSLVRTHCGRCTVPIHYAGQLRLITSNSRNNMLHGMGCTAVP